jgi:xylulokinase
MNPLSHHFFPERGELGIIQWEHVMSIFLGIDVSTTSAKALLINEHGVTLAIASTPLELSTPKPLWSEQDPNAWWRATGNSIRDALQKAKIQGGDVTGVGLTGQMHGLVLLDGEGKVLRPAILWNDQRTGLQCDQIRDRIGKARLIQITGNDALTGFTSPKILWVQQNEPEIFARARHILLPKDYIRFRLTGEFAMDKADGSGTALFDVRKRTWSEEMRAALEIPASLLPPTFEGPEVTGKVTTGAAQETGLAAGTPVMAGGGDQAAQGVGVGAVEPGIVALTVGTSGVVFAATNSPLIEPEGRLHAFCHALPDTWHLMGVMLSAAGSLQWYRDTLAPGINFDELVKEAETIPAGCEGLIFLPYLSGERTPYPDPLARGAFIGLTLRHTRAHMTRAVLEGVAFGLKDSFTLIQQVGLGTITQVRASGGGIKSPLWRQILADVLGTELVTVNSIEGAAFGAALLASVGAGVWPSVPAACHSLIRGGESVQPDERQADAYRGMYSLYRDLYPALKNSFEKM